MVLQEVFVAVAAAALHDTALLVVDQFEHAPHIFDAVYIVARLPAEAVDAAQLSSRRIVGIGHRSPTGRHRLWQVQEIVGDARDVVGGAAAVHPRQHIAIGIIAIVGGALSAGQNFLYNKETWRSLQYGRSYSQRFHGSQFVTDKAISRNISRGLNVMGKGLGVYNAYSVNQQYQSGQISGVQMSMEQGSNVFSTFGGIPGAAWGVGWEIGRSITTIPQYQQWKYSTWLPWRQQNLGY